MKRASSADGGRTAAYLDNAATTPMRNEALAAMLPFLSDDFANPSGVYSAGRRARRAIDDARDQVASLIGCAPGEVVFTGGGTEADNLAVLGAASFSGGVVVTTSIEHHAVLNPSRRVQARVVAASAEGVVDLDALARALDDTVALVSVMAVNNELGTIQPLAEVAELARSRAPQALVHSDAVQAAPFLDLAEVCRDCDLVSVSAHKIGGPKGVGALAVRGRASGHLAAVLSGGGQERALRPGTENVAGIVAFGEAAAATLADRQTASAAGRLAARPLRRRIARGRSARSKRASRVRESLRASPMSASQAFSQRNCSYCSTRQVSPPRPGSACSSGALEPSHVLRAVGWEPAAAREAIRFTLGHATSAEEVDHALNGPTWRCSAAEHRSGRRELSSARSGRDVRWCRLFSCRRRCSRTPATRSLARR